MLIENKILDISENYDDYLMNLENVVGIGMGYKYINKIDTLEPCIHVLVKKKLDKKYISSSNLIPKTYMGIKTDVIQTGIFSTCSETFALPQRTRPLEGGVSIRPNLRGVGIGTLGCIVSKKIFNKRYFYILSNNHVLADGNRIPLGTGVLQPGKIKNKDDEVGFLEDFIPVNFKKSFLGRYAKNYVDCAIARIYNVNDVSNKIFIAGKIKGVAEPRLNLSVKKVGMASGISYGKIITIGVSLNVNFGEDSTGKKKNCKI